MSVPLVELQRWQNPTDKMILDLLRFSSLGYLVSKRDRRISFCDLGLKEIPHFATPTYIAAMQSNIGHLVPQVKYGRDKEISFIADPHDETCGQIEVKIRHSPVITCNQVGAISESLIQIIGRPVDNPFYGRKDLYCALVLPNGDIPDKFSVVDKSQIGALVIFSGFSLESHERVVLYPDSEKERINWGGALFLKPTHLETFGTYVRGLPLIGATQQRLCADMHC